MKSLKTIKLFSVYGVPVYIHWSIVVSLIILGILGFKHPLLSFFAMSALLLTFFHELGHAWLAWKYKLRVHYISLHILHGECVHDKADTEFVNYMIAWGGVLAQAIIAVPVMLIILFYKGTMPDALEVTLFTLGYFNLLIIIFNLLPFRGLDGAVCWRAIPLHMKYRIKKPKKRKNHLKSVK